jgi:hypothetical protein
MSIRLWRWTPMSISRVSELELAILIWVRRSSQTHLISAEDRTIKVWDIKFSWWKLRFWRGTLNHSWHSKLPWKRYYVSCHLTQRKSICILKSLDKLAKCWDMSTGTLWPERSCVWSVSFSPVARTTCNSGPQTKPSKSGLSLTTRVSGHLNNNSHLSVRRRSVKTERNWPRSDQTGSGNYGTKKGKWGVCCDVW